MKWQVGQRVIAVVGNSWSSKVTVRDATVTAVARKWVSIAVDGYSKPWRFDGKTGSIDGSGYSSPGRCYPSRVAYEDELARRVVWRSIGKITSHESLMPDHLTLDDLRAILARLDPDHAS